MQESDAEMQSQQDTSKPQAKQLTVNRSSPDDQQSATYSFRNEDHTLGNLLRNQIIKNKEVEFCAYSMPHPSEPICNVRIQVSEQSQVDTDKVLKSSLKRISKLCDVLSEKFSTSLT